MKARDIIPGWPRGRTSIPAFAPWRIPLTWHLDFRLSGKSDADRFAADYHASVRYHEAQRLMVWCEWERYRNIVIVPTNQEISDVLDRRLSGFTTVDMLTTAGDHRIRLKEPSK
jgi:hypothetical protein